MPAKRSYADLGDACATAHAIELIGDVWTYPVLRELMLAPKRFNELLGSLPGITPAVLAARLRELDDRGLLHRVLLPAPAGVPVYELTEWARRLGPILDALGRWAHDSPTRVAAGDLTPDATAQALRTMAPPGPVDPPLALGLHLHDPRTDRPGYDYRIDWAADGFRIERGDHPQPQAVVTAGSTELTGAVLAGLDPTGMRVTGDAAAVNRLIELFASATTR